MIRHKILTRECFFRAIWLFEVSDTSFIKRLFTIFFYPIHNSCQNHAVEFGVSTRPPSIDITFLVKKGRPVIEKSLCQEN